MPVIRHTAQSSSQPMTDRPSSEAAKASALTLKPLTTCTVAQQMQVLELKNALENHNQIHADHEVSLGEHLQWIEKHKDDSTRQVFAVLDDADALVSIVGLDAIDTLNKKANWSLYLNESNDDSLSIAIEFFLIEYAFHQLGLEKLNCEIIESNQAIFKLHKKFHFVEEGFRRHDIEKKGVRYGVFLLGLTRHEWVYQRETFLCQHADVLNKFSLTFSMAQSHAASVIEQIQQVRAKNNINWMTLLKLSMEERPGIARPIIAEIMKLDREISDLTSKLVS